MIYRPILFSAPMVRAILDGTKTQTRRVAKPQPTPEFFAPHLVANHYSCPHGAPGDRLWVRESGWEPYPSAQDIREGADTWPKYAYDADMAALDFMQAREWRWKRRPSIHMPRWASRITLELTDVRVERVQDITPSDARSEGCACIYDDTGRVPHVAFRPLWDSINAARGYGWAVNPWVWVVSFKRITP